MNNFSKYVKNINWKLYFSLLVMGFCPTIYTTVRVFLIGKLPGEWSFSIAGQLTWINLIYEILNEAIILPLYYFMGKAVSDRKEFVNRIKTGLIISFCVYAVCSVLVICFVFPLLSLMATNKNIIAESASYIRIESIANIFHLLESFLFVCIVILGKSAYLYVLTIIKLVLSVISDVFFVSNLTFSLHLGVNGIAYSNIVVSGLLFFISIFLIYQEGYSLFGKEKISFSWIRSFIKIGGISGLESFVRNIAYIFMISRMVNIVNEQGTYWVANNFIWGYLLLPVLKLGELIKQDVGTDKRTVKTNTIGYLIIIFCICLIWLVTIPFWKPFMKNVLQFSEVNKLYNLVMILLVFYVFYAIQNVFDSEFYALGKTEYLLLESVITNVVYYGSAFVLYLKGFWVPSLTRIAFLFGFGNVFDSFLTGLLFVFFLKKSKIRIF